MKLAREHKALGQLLAIRERKVQRAQQLLVAEQVALTREENQLRSLQNEHLAAQQDAKRQENEWFQEAALNPLTSNQLEQLLAKVGLLRDAVADKAKAALEQEQSVENQKVALQKAQHVLQQANREFVKLEQLQEKSTLALARLQEQKENEAIEEIPVYAARAFS